MLQPPPLTSVPRYPVTAGIGIAAIAVTLLWWSGTPIMELLGEDGRIWSQWQIWRGLTTTLPHGGFLHLAFNLYWWWVFGTFLERVFGHLKLLGIFALLALTSSLAEFMLLRGGVGLSGAGYGLWGMFWALESRDPRFADTVDQRTNQVFVVWFFVCIVLTLTNVLPVANLAHGVGAITGALLGLAVGTSRSRKWRSIAALTALMLVVLAGSTVLWPWVNLTDRKYEAAGVAGWKALEQKDNLKACRLLELAVHNKNAPAGLWYDLGIAYGRLHRDTNALAAFEQAVRLPDATDDMRRAARQTRMSLEFKRRIKEITNHMATPEALSK